MKKKIKINNNIRNKILRISRKIQFLLIFILYNIAGYAPLHCSM